MSNLRKILIGLSIASLALFFGWLAIAGKSKKVDRSEILERAREAKMAKSLAKKSDDSPENLELDET